MILKFGQGAAAVTAAAISALLIASPAQAEPKLERSVKVAPGGVYELVFNPADNDIYIAAVGPRGQTIAEIAHLDGKTLAVEGGISVASDALYGLGLNSRTQMLYGTATRTNSVGVVNLKTRQVVATIKDESGESAHVREAIVDEQRNKVYVTLVGADAGDADRRNEIWVIDGATNTLERKIAVPVGGLTGAALDVAANRIYVTGMRSNDVAAIDLATDKVIGRWPSGGETPINVAVDAEGQRLFVANQKSGTLTVLNASTGALISSVPTGAGALSVAFNGAVKQAYVSNRDAGTVTVVDTTSYAVLANLKTGTFPQTIAIDRKTNTVYVTNKARGLPRNAPAGTPVPVDEAGDTVSVIRP